MAHIGVLKVLDVENIKIHSTTGCSMGASIKSRRVHIDKSIDTAEVNFLPHLQNDKTLSCSNRKIPNDKSQTNSKC